MEALKPSGYWDEKILSWETSRYDHSGSLKGKSLQSRMSIAAEILSAMPPGKSVVDIGCGSGRLFELLKAANFSHLVGWDISAVAIEAARAKKTRGENIAFECADVSQKQLPVADCYVGLGLFDWLTDDDIRQIFSQINGRLFLFSFSERRALPLQLAHKVYRRLTAYGRHAKYIPRYHSAAQIADFAAGDTKSEAIKFYRPEGMAFGSFVSNIPGLEKFRDEVR